MRTFCFFAIALFLLPVYSVLAQQSDVLDGAYVKEHVPARKPIPYHYLREADVMWSKKIWRMLDLKEKINHPLYYPTQDKAMMDNRYSLGSLLFYGLDNQGMVFYDDEEFVVPKSLTQIDKDFGAVNDTDDIEDVNNPGTYIKKVIPGTRKFEQVSRLMIKEEWYFDKQRAMMEVRIIGLCPIRLYEKSAGSSDQAATGGEEEKEWVPVQLFWAYFPAIRDLLANHEVFNQFNDAERRTFDDIFFKRRFSSFIFKETNVYNNRRINEYAYGLDAQLESEKIKEFMFKLEHDLWEF
jgi:gliding motility associated protien GldN